MNTELIFERVMRRLLTEASNCDFKEITELSVEDQRLVWKRFISIKFWQAITGTKDGRLISGLTNNMNSFFVKLINAQNT